MADVNFSYGFQEHPVRNGAKIQRPMLNVRLTHGDLSIDTNLLLDSGADYSMIQREMAEGLGIDVAQLKTEKSNSVGGTMDVAFCDIDVTLAQGRNQETFKSTFQVPLNCPGYPVLPLIGREPLFSLFDINFRMGFTDARGKFTLRKVEKQRDSGGFLIGGRKLR